MAALRARSHGIRVIGLARSYGAVARTGATVAETSADAGARCAPDGYVGLVALRVVQDGLGAPPENADEWSDQQWIDWLTATDDAVAPPGRAIPVTRAGRVTHSAGGQLLGAAMIGLARAIYGRQEDRPAVVVESGEPDDGGLASVHLDLEQPDRSYVLLPEEPGRTGQ